jgi:nucleoside-diphosphate-sugar epimerase
MFFPFDLQFIRSLLKWSRKKFQIKYYKDFESDVTVNGCDSQLIFAEEIPMRVLVTGAAGFIGSHLVDQLLSLDYDVVGLDNLSGSQIDNLNFLTQHPRHSKLSWVEGDIRDLDTCHTAVHGCSYVFHLAAAGSVPRSVEDPRFYHENNITGTFNVLTAARDAEVERVVFASSSAVYGDSPELPKREEMAPIPLSPYAVSKLTGEAYCTAFYHSYGLKTVALRYFNVFGPRQNPYSQYAAVIPKFVAAAQSHVPMVIYGDGMQTRDFIYVEDVVSANILACSCPDELLGKAINVGTGERITVNQLAYMVSDMTKKTPIDYVDARAVDIKDSIAATDRLKRLGLTDLIDIADGLSRTVAWMTAQS